MFNRIWCNCCIPNTCISNDIRFNLLGKNLLKQADCEDIWVEFKFPGIKNGLTIAIIYRHPNGRISQFIDLLDKTFNEFNLSTRDLYMLDDININILPESCTTNDLNYSSMLASKGLFSLITKPTRVSATSSTLIDHIFTNSIADKLYPGVILNDISDHYMVYSIISVENKQTSSKCITCKKVRNFKNVNYEQLSSDLSVELTKFKTSLPQITSDNFNSVFTDFLNCIKTQISNHAPLQIVSRKQRRIQAKPWITKGLLISIKHKQKLYRTHYLTQNLSKQQFYKTYSNKLSKVKRKAKISYYYDLFKENVTNPRKTWSIINELISRKKKSNQGLTKIYTQNRSLDNPADIANCFNQHFCDIGKNHVNSNFCEDSPSEVTRFLKSKRCDTIFLKPVTDNEILNIIHGLNANKATGNDEIPCFIVKLIANIIAPILTTLTPKGT